MPADSRIGPAGRLRATLRRITGAEGRLSSLFRGSALVMATQIAGIGLAYAMQVAVARWAGAFEFGLFAYAWTWMNLIFLVAAFGLNESALRLIPLYSSHAQWGKLRGLVIRGPAVVFGLATLAGLAGAGALLILGDRVGEPYRLPLLLTFTASPLFGLLAFFQGIGRALGGVMTAFLPRYIGMPAIVLTAVGAIVLSGGVPDATRLIEITIGAGALLVLVQGVLLLRDLPAEAKGISSVAPTAEWMRLSLPLLFIAVCFGLLTHCDLLLVGALLSAEEVALYQAASRTAALVSFPLFALNALVAPMIARLHAEGRIAELQRSVSLATQMVFWPSLIGALLAVAGGRYILGIFGPAFTAAHLALGILIVGHLVNVAVGPVSYLMTMTGNQHRCAGIWAATVVLQVALDLILIPRWGIEGAAIGTACATTFLGLALTILVKRRLDISAHAFVPVWRTLSRAVRI